MSTLGSVIFSNPHIQASIKNITLSIGETLGFPKSIESYTEVLNTSKEDKGITVTLKEVVLDNGVLLTKVHAEKTSSGQKGTDDVQDAWTFANTQLDIDYQKTTINGQKIEEYESGRYLPYSDEDLLNTGLDENVYDAVDPGLAARMHKAIAIIQFKVEGAMIMRIPNTEWRNGCCFRL